MASVVDSLEMDNDFSCTECSSVFFKKKALIKHCKEVHNTKKPLEQKLDDEQIPKGRSIQTFKCKDCDNVFRKECTLKVHMSYDHGEIIKEEDLSEDFADNVNGASNGDNLDSEKL